MTDNEHGEIDEKNVKFYVRILPLEKPCETCARIDTRRKKIYVRCSQELRANRIAIPRDPSYWCFDADEIFYDSSQDDVYRAIAKDLPSKILDGTSCVLIGYGQTGSGKSFTIGGFRNNWEHRGLISPLLSDMFAEKANRKRISRIECGLSCVELHGRETLDLLAPGRVNKIKVKEYDPFKDISTISVESHKEALEKVFEAESKRSIVKGSSYPNSHLATFVVTFHVRNTSLITSWRVVTMAKLHVVELAGNDTVGSTNCKKTAFDVGAANLTMTQLEQFFLYLRGRETLTHSAIRSNNMLKLLGSALSATSIVRLISHIRITRKDLAITISTLRFGAKISKFRPVMRTRNVLPRAENVIKELQDEVNSLRKELDINNSFLNQEALMNISRSRAEQIKTDVLNFLNGYISDFTLFSVSQAQVLMKIMKELYNELTAQGLKIKNLAESTEDTTQKNDYTKVNHNASKNSASELQEIEGTKQEVGTLEKFSITLGPVLQKYLMSETENPHKYFKQSREIIKKEEQEPSMERQKWEKLRFGYIT